MIEPVTKELTVPASPAEAFARFTDGIDGWWPKASHSVGEERCRWVGFRSAGDERHLLEETEDGAEHVWGTVSVWEPGARLVFSWHPGRDPSGAQEVEVTFTAQGEETRVRLVHGGWEALGGEGLDRRDEYEKGWDPVLAGYQGALTATQSAP